MKTILLTLLLSLNARAGNLFTYTNLGFSPDGKYYAYIQTTYQDGSGFPQAIAAVVDVKANKFVASKNIILQNENATVESAYKKAVKELALSKYKIKAGSNPGTNLLVRMETDKSEYTNNLFSKESYPEGGASVFAPRYEIVIEQKNDPKTGASEQCFTEQSMLTKISLLGKEGSDNENIILQEDESLPKSRVCGYDYKLARVIYYKNSLVVVSTFKTIGFEGPDYQQMVTTGFVNLR